MVMIHFGRIDIVLLILNGIIFLIPMASSFYFAVVFLRSPYRRMKPLQKTEPKTRFAVIIPACNEERVIRRALDSLQQLDYPRELFDVIVIADNCTDATASIAADCGIRVMERFDLTRRSKAHAMHWAFFEHGLLDAGYDAVCIIDADNKVSSTFLRFVESRISEGHVVVQGRCKSINPFDTFVSSFLTLIIAMVNRMWALPLENCGISTLYSGTGVAIRCDHIRNIGWDINTLVEDVEFSLQTVLSGHKVRYCDEAVYFTEHPADFSSFWRQQRRWMSGNIACGQLFFSTLTDRYLKEKDASSVMGIFKLLLPYACIAGFLQIILGPILSIAILGAQIFTPFAIVCYLLYAQLTGMVSAIVILLLDGSLCWRMWKGVLCFSMYPVFFGLVSLTSLMQPKRNWELIEHGLKGKVKTARPFSTET